MSHRDLETLVRTAQDPRSRGIYEVFVMEVR